MYEKILTMERVMQAEIDQLKQREMELIQCLQKDREKLVDERNSLERVRKGVEGLLFVKNMNVNDESFIFRCI